MARNETVPERVAVLETEWRHLLSALSRLESELQSQKRLLRQYERVGAMVAIGGIMYWPGAWSAEAAGRFVKPLLELILRAL